MNDKLPITCYVNFYDEHDIIEKSLSRVAFCNQIIFLDDSDDGSGKKYSDKFGCEYYRWTGENSMSERRNFSVGFTGNDEYTPEFVDNKELMDNLPEVKNEWILQLDADEVFGKNLKKELSEFLGMDEAEDINTVLFILVNLRKDGTGMGDIPLERMFRTGTIWWEHAVQNDPHFQGPSIVVPVKINHHGYADLEHQWLKQWKRLPQLEKEVEDSPFDLHRRKYLINALSITLTSPINFDRLFANVTFICEQFIQNKEKAGISENALLQRVFRHFWQACITINRVQPFKILISRVWDHVRFHPDSQYFLFSVCRAEGRLEPMVYHGEEYFEKLEDFSKNVQRIEVTTRSKQEEVCDGIYQACTILAQQGGDKAEEYRNKAKKWAEIKLKNVDKKELLGEKE